MSDSAGDLLDKVVDVESQIIERLKRADDDGQGRDGRPAKHRRLHDNDFLHKGCLVPKDSCEPVEPTTSTKVSSMPIAKHAATESASYLAATFQKTEEMRQQAMQRCQQMQKKRLAERLQQQERGLQSTRTKAIIKEQILASLEPCQRKALAYVESKAKAAHEAALGQLEERIKPLIPRSTKAFRTNDTAKTTTGSGSGSTTPSNHNDDSLQNLLDYIRDEAPLAVHIKQNVFEELLQDTNYRSLFETNTSNGNKSKESRSCWEHVMFGGEYNGCAAVDRPKYGVLNITGDICGVKVARGYGTFVMTLANHVRYRTTFFGKDTGGFLEKNSLATNEWYGHILQSLYTDVELQAVLSVCRIGGASSSKISSYKEIQIHGPICLETDIQSLSVPGFEATVSPEFRKQVAQFQNMTGCNILWQGDLLGMGNKGEERSGGGIGGEGGVEGNGIDEDEDEDDDL